MEELAFWKAVTVDHADLLEQLVKTLADNKISYCVIGGVAVNAYTDPIVTLDIDIVIAVEQLDRAEQLLAEKFVVKRFPYSLNFGSPNSRLRVQIQLDPRYASFIARATPQAVLNLVLPVADPLDLLHGKLWAYQDPERRPMKHEKDVMDVARLVHAYPAFRKELPGDLVAELVRRRLLDPIES